MREVLATHKALVQRLVEMEGNMGCPHFIVDIRSNIYYDAQK